MTDYLPGRYLSMGIFKVGRLLPAPTSRVRMGILRRGTVHMRRPGSCSAGSPARRLFCLVPALSEHLTSRQTTYLIRSGRVSRRPQHELALVARLANAPAGRLAVSWVRNL